MLTIYHGDIQNITSIEDINLFPLLFPFLFFYSYYPPFLAVIRRTVYLISDPPLPASRGVWWGGEGRGWSRAEVGMAMGSVERRVKVGIGSKKRGEEGRDGDGECGEERRGG
jgi:hypothetical protein